MMNKKNVIVLLTILMSSLVPIAFAQEEVPYGPWVDEIRFESGFEEPILFEKMKRQMLLCVYQCGANGFRQKHYSQMNNGFLQRRECWGIQGRQKNYNN